MQKHSKDTMFSVDSWNHPCYGEKNWDYHMIWGPYPLSKMKEIKDTVLKNFDKKVKYVLYKHQAV